MPQSFTPIVGQTELWTPTEMRTPSFEDLGILPNQIISMSRLLKAVSHAMDVPASYATEAEFSQSTPGAMRANLHISREDPRAHTAENLFMGVIHPTEEFTSISRSPREIARQVKGRTRKSFNLEEVVIDGVLHEKATDKAGIEVDRDEISARVRRSGGHALEGFIEKLTTQKQKLAEQEVDLIALESELASPGRAHYKAVNLDRLRRSGERAVRESIEIASINAEGWSSLTVDGLHKAAMYKIYGMPGHNNARIGYFRPWTILTRDWTKVRGYNVRRALDNAQKELKIYQPALDAKRPA